MRYVSYEGQVEKIRAGRYGYARNGKYYICQKISNYWDVDLGGHYCTATTLGDLLLKIDEILNRQAVVEAEKAEAEAEEPKPEIFTYEKILRANGKVDEAAGYLVKFAGEVIGVVRKGWFRAGGNGWTHDLVRVPYQFKVANSRRAASEDLYRRYQKLNEEPTEEPVSNFDYRVSMTNSKDGDPDRPDRYAYVNAAGPVDACLKAEKEWPQMYAQRAREIIKIHGVGHVPFFNDLPKAPIVNDSDIFTIQENGSVIKYNPITKIMIERGDYRQEYGLDTSSGSKYSRLRMEGYSDLYAQASVYFSQGILAIDQEKKELFRPRPVEIILTGHNWNILRTIKMRKSDESGAMVEDKDFLRLDELLDTGKKLVNYCNRKRYKVLNKNGIIPELAKQFIY
jgi:hypothetical protein